MPIPVIVSIQYLNNADGSIVVPSGLVNSVMVVCTGTHQGNVTSISYGGNALTKIAEGSSAFNEDGAIWVLLNPTAGTATLDITTDGGSWWGATVFIVEGAKQTTTITNNKIDSASGLASAMTLVPPDTNCLIFGSAGGEASYTSSNSPGQMTVTTAQQGQSFENHRAGYAPSKGGNPITFSFGMSSGQRYGMAMVAIESAGNDM